MWDSISFIINFLGVGGCIICGIIITLFVLWGIIMIKAFNKALKEPPRPLFGPGGLL